MNLITVALAGCVVAFLLAALRILRGPTPADRAIGADLLLFAVIAVIALFGAQVGSGASLDLVLVATLVAFLGAISLARALTGGRR